MPQKRNIIKLSMILFQFFLSFRLQPPDLFRQEMYPTETDGIAVSRVNGSR